MPKPTFSHQESIEDKPGVWRIGANDLEDFIAEAYRKTASVLRPGVWGIWRKAVTDDWAASGVSIMLGLAWCSVFVGTGECGGRGRR